MDMIFKGCLINLLQVSQLSVTMPSCDLKTLFDNQLSRMNRSTELSSGGHGGTDRPNSLYSQCTRSTQHQRTTSWIAGSGPLSTNDNG
jgi:hypothetical protein